MIMQMPPLEESADEMILDQIFDMVDDESTPLDLEKIALMIDYLSDETRDEVEGFMEGLLGLVVRSDEARVMQQ